MEEKHLVKINYSREEVAEMYNESSKTLMVEIEKSIPLQADLMRLGWHKGMKGFWNKAQVITIFHFLGAPEGYEHYEKEGQK